MAVVGVVIVLGPACNPDGGGNTGGSTGSTGPTGETTGTTESVADETATDTDGGPPVDIHGFADACVSIHQGDDWLVPSAAGDSFAFVSGEAEQAGRFYMKASDLGTYLLYDQDGGYVVAEDGPLLRQTTLVSDVLLVDDEYVSGAEWLLEPTPADPARVHLRNRRTDAMLGLEGLVADDGEAVAVRFEPASGCAEHPELSLDATGEVTQTTFEDGALYGIVDTHSHILSNFGFGGGGIFHGAPFHRLGVEHALPDCALYHGDEGRKDFFGYAFDNAGPDGADLTSLVPDILAGELSMDNHATTGYPEFTDWPNGPGSSTHQTQYYRWLERAYLGGLRLVIQHATTNSVICDFTVGAGLQPARYDCSDMTAVDRIIDETYAMERYVDAQAGGPGLGWFRVVQAPEQARQIITEGKMAVVLGIETSELFRCALTPSPDEPICDEAYIAQQLDEYYDRGVRAIFPVHKYDNAFSPGDGDRAFIELGNFLNSGHWSNFTEDCPPDVTAIFDRGDVFFGGLNMPRDDYDAPPPHDFSGFPQAPVPTLLPFLGPIGEPPIEGDYCQNATLTPLGETLLTELMARGMIIEIDHLPRWSYQRALEILEQANYPAVGTHGGTAQGRIYQLGGVSKTGLGRCRDATPGAMLQRLQERITLITDNGGYPAEGFGFDLNGFAGAPGPRFADGACPIPQEDPVTYPFSSYAGDVEFTEPVVGNRVIDFNQEGLVHIGLLPELLEDARKDAVSEDDLEPLFRSAEAYIRMWERAQERAAEL